MNHYHGILCTALLVYIIGQSHASESDYIFVDSTDSYYRFYRKPVDWKDWNGALAACRSEGAVLFHPDDKHELDQVVNGFKMSNQGWNLFLGFSDLEQKDFYKTVDGRPLNQVFHDWDPVYSFRNNFDRRCGGVEIDDRTIHVKKCEENKPFLCKRKLNKPATQDIAEKAVQRDADLGRIATALEKLADAFPALMDALRPRQPTAAPPHRE